jgi:hypothetical protein
MAQANVTVLGVQSGRSMGYAALLRAAVGLGVSWLACGGASDDGLVSPVLTSSQAGTGGVPGAPDAGGPPETPGEVGDCRGAPCSECPQVLTDSAAYLGPITVWARNPASGTCCPYADHVFTPAHFPAFDSPEACESSCRCAELIEAAGSSAEEAQSWVSERISLECYCSEKTCLDSPEAIALQRCGGDHGLHRSEGCGRTMIEEVTGLGVIGTWVFDQATGALIGVSEASDVTSFPCRSYGTRAGAELDCPEAERCRVCGEAERDRGETTPPCEG